MYLVGIQCASKSDHDMGVQTDETECKECVERSKAESDNDGGATGTFSVPEVSGNGFYF